ncbi:uncharacterized protein LOC124266804 [Haliotis rubra]|uniref:uncharacterized protein LOC124266804 n=1 Tax=Haliotis rubra TaxID=36100 RepID=UPI001EE5B37C|nr:uncharacterized protein LOC124266804 [Haliotis rubra]
MYIYLRPHCSPAEHGRQQQERHDVNKTARAISQCIFPIWTKYVSGQFRGYVNVNPRTLLPRPPDDLPHVSVSDQCHDARPVSRNPRGSNGCNLHLLQTPSQGCHICMLVHQFGHADLSTNSWFICASPVRCVRPRRISGSAINGWILSDARVVALQSYLLSCVGFRFCRWGYYISFPRCAISW